MGVNAFQSATIEPIEILQIDQTAHERTGRETGGVAEAPGSGSTSRRSLRRYRSAAESTENTMPYILDAVRAYATLGEICERSAGSCSAISGNDRP